LQKLLHWLVWMDDEGGATAIEYALIAGAMAIAIVPAMSSLAGGTGGLFQTVLGLFDDPIFH
jgi:Flp pilus assembly pilin Flp